MFHSCAMRTRDAPTGLMMVRASASASKLGQRDIMEATRLPPRARRAAHRSIACWDSGSAALIPKIACGRPLSRRRVSRCACAHVPSERLQRDPHHRSLRAIRPMVSRLSAANLMPPREMRL